MKLYKYLIIFGLGLIASSCEEFLDKPQPVDLIVDEIVIEDQATAEQAVLGMYNSFQSANSFGNLIVTTPGVLSDELVHTGSFPTVAQQDDNDVTPDNVTNRSPWTTAYRGIYIANTVLERIGSVEMDEDLRDQLIGEAKFGHALFHLQLLTLWGDVPLANTTDLGALRVIDRTSKQDVFAYLITELTEAAALLEGVDYGDPGRDDEDRFRANEWAAKALLARVYLYAGNLVQAGAMANDVIENGDYALTTNYSSNFVPNGNPSEVIFKIFASATDANGLAFQFKKVGGRYEYGPSEELKAAYEPDDERAGMLEELGDGTVQVIKYQDTGTGTDQPVVLRLAEMYLIRAEANLGTTQADDDINIIRDRAGLGDLSDVTLDDVLQERFVELAFEGHRWFDLIRTNRVDAVMSVVNPGSWQGTDVLQPIPLYDMQQNPTLAGKQNPGY